MKPIVPANENQIDRTRKVWEPRLACDLTGDDARQIRINVTGFFRTLAEWSLAETVPAANDNDPPISGGGADNDR